MAYIKNIGIIVKLLRKEVSSFQKPMSTEISEKTHDPFKVLVSCILSLRTRDTITYPISNRLFAVADTPKKIKDLPLKKLQEIIRPVNYYKTKSRRIKEISKALLENYHGNVPNTFDELMSFKGVGRKTANIVMVYGFGSRHHIPVDTHVHRIPNRLGWVKTKTPEQTEEALKQIIPQKYWSDINDLLVMHGQNICQPISPWCSKCLIKAYCKRIGVKKSR